MTAYSIVNPTALASGQPEDITVVLSNFQALQAVINGNLDDSNVKAGAGILPSKLANYPANSGLYLRGDGTWGPIGAHTSSAPSGTNVDLPWNGGGAHSLVDDLSPSGVPTLRSYGAPPGGEGTRLVFRTANPITFLSNVTTGSGPFYTSTPSNPTTIGVPGVIHQIEFMYFVGYWIEINRDVPLYENTSLPTNPSDGQEAVLVDSVSNPTWQWRFRYNAGSSSAYKWEFIGGDDYWSTAYLGGYTAISNGFQAVAPIFITPRAGDWDTIGATQITCATANSLGQLSIGTTSAGLVATANMLGAANSHMSIVNSNVLLAIPSGTQISLWISGSNAMSVANNWIRVRPRRVA
jgi:hypothetical protein